MNGTFDFLTFLLYHPSWAKKVTKKGWQSDPQIGLPAFTERKLSQYQTRSQ